MMQGNESQRPDERDYKVFGLINDWVRLYPEQFIETGQFLDESYSEAEIRKRDAKERREDKKLGVPRDEIRKPSKLKTFSVATSDLLAQLGDVRIDRHDIGDSVEPWTEALGLHSGHKNFHDMRDEDKARIAKLVLLLTWLVTEPDADSFDVQITFLQYWPWDDGDACSTSDVQKQKQKLKLKLKIKKKEHVSNDAELDRRLARDVLLKYNAAAWCDLARKSWNICSELIGTEGSEDTNPSSQTVTQDAKVLVGNLITQRDPVESDEGGLPESSFEADTEKLTIVEKALPRIKEAYPEWITSNEIGKLIGTKGKNVRPALSKWAKNIPGDLPYESNLSGKHLGYRWLDSPA